VTLKCDNHPDREAWNCSGWCVKRYLCEECRAAMNSSSAKAAARAGWINGASGGYWEMFGGRSGISDHAYHNPNAIYERAQAQNKDIINDK